MINQSQVIKDMTFKSKTASAAFAFFAVFVFSFAFNTRELSFIIRAACVGVWIASILRVWACNQTERLGEEKLLLFTRFSVVLNSLSWAVIFSAVSVETGGDGIDYMCVLLLMAGFCAASLITLSFDRFCFSFFNVVLLGSQALFPIIAQLNGDEPGHWRLAFIMIGFLAYQFVQFKDFKKLTSHS